MSAGQFYQIELVGIDTLIRTLAVGKANTALALLTALQEEANLAFRQSQREVPYRYGILKGSGRVSSPAMSGGRVVVEISYGGAARAYAYIMHRGILHGKPINYRGGKKAQYLSDPVNRAAAGSAARIEKRIARILGA